jgi:hypothetical protein
MGSLTTPDPIALMRTLDELAGEGAMHLAMKLFAWARSTPARWVRGIAAAGFTKSLARLHGLSSDHRDVSLQPSRLNRWWSRAVLR